MAQLRSILLAFAGFLLFFTCALVHAWDGHIIGSGDGPHVFAVIWQTPKTLWLDAQFAGFPLFADPQVLMWYPPARLLQLVGLPYDAFVILGYALAGTSAFTLALVLTNSVRAAWLAGFVLSCSGITVIHFEHPTMVHGIAWVPFAITAFILFERTRRPAWIAAAAFCIGSSVLAGAPQVALYGSLLVGAFCLAQAVSQRSPRPLVAGAVAAALGVGLSAIQMLPTAELSKMSVRDAITFDMFVWAAYLPRHLVTLLFPRFFHFEGAYFGPSDVDLGGFVGTSTFIFVAAAAFGARKDGARFWLGAAVLATALTLGRNGPAAFWLFKVPGYNLFRIPTRHFFEVAVAASVLAALGYARLEAAPDKSLGRKAVGAVVLLLILVVQLVGALPARFADAPLPARFTTWPFENLSILVPMLFTGVVAALVLSTRRWALTLVPVVVAAELLISWSPWKLGSATESFLELPAPLAPLKAEMAQTPGRLLVPQGYWDPLVPGNATIAWGLPSVGGYNVLLPRRLEGLVGIDANGVVRDQGATLSASNSGLDLVGARWVLKPVGDPPLDPARFSEGPTLGSHRVWKNERAFPRAWLTPSARKATDEEALAVIRHGPPETFKETTLSDELETVSRPADPSARVELATVTPTRLALRTTSATDSVLVTSDLWYPGWRATVDGAETPVRRVNYGLRGAEVPAGQHEVVFEFAPGSFRRGLLITSASLLTLVALFVLGRRARMPTSA